MDSKKIILWLVGIIIVALIVWQLVRVFGEEEVNEITDVTDVPVDILDNSDSEITSVVDVETLETDVTTAGLSAEVKDSNTTATLPSNPVTLSPQEELKISLTKLAGSFVERMGSYSSDSNYENLKALYPLMSTSMKNWADGVIDGGNVPSETFSIRLKVLSSEIEEIGDNDVTAVVTVQKEKEEFGLESVTYQKADVNIVKIGEDWLVDDVDWREEGVL